MNNYKELSNSEKLKHSDTSHTQTLSGFRRKVKLAPIQQDLYLYNLIHPGSNTFNIGFSVNLGIDVDRAKWEAAVRWVVQNDDITQTYILFQDDEPYQVIDPQSSVFFEYVELTESPIAVSSAEQYLWEQNEKPIDLSIPPLFRNYLIKDRHKEYTAGFLMPHILFDGVAAQAFFNRSVLVTQESLAGRFSRNECKIVCLDSDRDSIQLKSKQKPNSHVNFNNLAYVIYTSGSTGKPKGVLVTHANVARLFHQTEKWFSFNNEDVWTLFHSSSFDFSVWELWGALIYGGRLVIIPKSISRSPEAFYDVLRKEKVTILNQTPTAFYNLMRVESSLPAPLPLVLRYVIFGGEALDLRALKPWVYKHGDLSPRLINSHIYRSGDLGRMLSNGDIEYLGRIDDQVKIRGFRIELGEISSTLLNHVAVAQAVVVSDKHVTGDSGKDPAAAENRLVAYVVPSNGDISFKDLRAYLRKKLPDYLVPSYFVQLESLPLTPNGKVDKKALLEPKVQRHSNQELILPQTHIEKVIASVWCEILSMEEVSIYDNFFDLGGHSLLATRIVRRLMEDLGTNLPLSSIYENPTIKDLAEFIETYQWAGRGDEFQLRPTVQGREIGEL